ncbi:deleted in malignant brain tumors 1 protein-like isoform X2 [Pomacea canaliculata]|uniref:deleted in malignant brain tumors 1 protein-like isoform X2 n=1 Tax=Pomacea canaliculata TaxID=400727 RepID=UPI000D73A0C3|nr:deleted in malignant brain tumors 1 protein-like isoform X2 [Pomacea canaliculata]
MELAGLDVWRIFENGIWNTVCDEEFGNNEAQGVCRMLGLNSPGAVSVTSDMYGVGSGQTLSVKMICTGTESKLSECKRDKLNDCNHSTDIGVICNIPGQITPRLVEGNASSGRLEILYNGTWNLVCDEGFGLQEAEVACRMLGFDSNGEARVMSLPYGNSSTRTISGNVTCRGTEGSLAECEHPGFNTIDCVKSQVVGISCSVPTDHTLRLANGHLWSGRLEIFYNQRWRTLCESGFGQREAQVVCGMLNYSSPGAIYDYPGRYGSGSEPVWLANVKCAGTETSLLRCSHDGLYEQDCGPLSDIAVICNIPGQIVPRLAEGTAWSGRLDLLYNGSWSSVCDDGFGHKEARVACRMLGFDRPEVFAVNSFLFRDYDRTALFSDLNCQGTETNLAECNYSSFYNYKCTHGRDIALICKAEKGDIRITGNYGTTYGVGRVEMRMESEWYSLCATSFSNDDAGVVCRQLGFNGTATTADVSLFGDKQGEVVVVDFNCSGREPSMFICLQKVESIREVCHTEEFGVICGEYPPSIITFFLNYQVDPTVTVTENSDVDMLCEAHGRPNPRMLFISNKDNKVLIDSKQNGVQLSEGKGQITTILRNVQCEDSADYRCEVENSVGRSNQSIRLLVPCSPRLKSFYAKLPSIEITNHRGNLSFEMTAYPAPGVKFIVHHGSTVNESVNIVSVKENVHVECVDELFAPASHTCKVTVRNMSAAHQGVYQIVFSNNRGEISFNFTVRLKGKSFRNSKNE